MGGATLTCFQAVLVKVGAAAVVGLAQVVTPASWRLGLLQLKAPPLAGAGGADPLRDDWTEDRGQRHM